MLQILLVGMGGFLGSVLRYLFSGWLHRSLSSDWFPYGTLGVNVLGCVLIGFLAGLEESHGVFTPETRLLIFIGLIGGFTTFSSFAYETFYLARSALYVTAFANIMGEVVMGLLAVWVGHILAR
jgi:fluoride exporter